MFAQHFSHHHCLKTFRSRDKQVRRVCCLFAAIILCSVAVADRNTQSEFFSPPLKTVHHVTVERSKRCNVECGKSWWMRFSKHPVKYRQKGTFGLSGSGRCNQNSIVSADELRDCPHLNLRELVKTPFIEGIPNFWMQTFPQLLNSSGHFSSGFGLRFSQVST